MKIHALSIALWVAAASFAVTAKAQNSGWVATTTSSSTIASGDYGDGLLIGINPDNHAVTGYFSASTGQGQFSCIFYLTGKLGSSSTPISTYFPDTPADKIKGELVSAPPDGLKVRLSSEHGGCWNVQHFADDSQPAEFTLVERHPWVSIAVVRSKRAYFFDTPTSPVHRKAYIVQGDGVGVRAVQSGWLQVDFVAGGKMASGWIRQAEVYPVE